MNFKTNAEEEEIHDNSEGNTRRNKQRPVDFFNRKCTPPEILIWGNFRDSQVGGIWSPSVRNKPNLEESKPEKRPT